MSLRSVFRAGSNDNFFIFVKICYLYTDKSELVCDKKACMHLNNNYGIMKRLLYLVSIIFAVAGCEKIDPFVETDEGNNVLGFYINGVQVSYVIYGGYSPWPYEHSVHTKWINSDSLEVSATLDNYYVDKIMIKIAVADINTQQDIIDPDIKLRYLYRKTPIPPSHNTSGGASMEYRYTNFVRGNLTIRTWNQAAGILSGNFDFECDAPLFDGTTKRLSVTKGNFDVYVENNEYE